MKYVLAALLLFQTPITTTSKLEWKVEAATAADAQGFEARAVVDSDTNFAKMASVTCTGSASPFTCQAPLPTAMVARLNAQGNHTIVVRLFNPSTGLEGADSAPFLLRVPPPAPTGVRIIP